jgi:aspartate/methionine/tyrosine aminotransferase
MAGGEPVYVPLRPNLSNTGGGASHVFELDADELRAAISPQTKALLLNTPHNPTGKMFSRAELEMIASVVKEHSSMIVISDEVYEHIVFDVEHEPHVSMATIPNMFDRTLTLSSAGKTFSCTGWKVGWAVGPQPLVRAVMAAQQWVNFSAPTPNQDAIARALVLAREPYQGFATYYDYLANEYKRKRGLLVAALEAANMTAVLPPGGFFVLADTSRIQFPEQYMDEVTEASPVPMTRDWAMSRWLTKEVGVTAIPPSAFYSQANMHLAGNFLRFAFCKGDDTLTEAHQRFKKYFK